MCFHGPWVTSHLHLPSDVLHRPRTGCNVMALGPRSSVMNRRPSSSKPYRSLTGLVCWAVVSNILLITPPRPEEDCPFKWGGVWSSRVYILYVCICLDIYVCIGYAQTNAGSYRCLSIITTFAAPGIYSYRRPGRFPSLRRPYVRRCFSISTFSQRLSPEVLALPFLHCLFLARFPMVELYPIAGHH